MENNSETHWRQLVSTINSLSSALRSIALLFIMSSALGNLMTGVPWWLFLGILAPFVGSFVGVLAVRLPNDRDVTFGRSHCDSCKRALGILDLIPVASWVSLRGRCRYCGAPVGLFYPSVELAALLVVLWAATVVSGPLLVASALLGWLLLCLGIADLRSHRLPDVLTILLGTIGLGAAWFFDHDRCVEHFIAAALAGALLLVVRLAYRQIRGREGLGFGDVKLFAAIGAWVSASGVPSVVFLGALLAMLMFLVRRWFGRATPHERIPFGPFLAMAAWLVWLYGPLVPAFPL